MKKIACMLITLFGASLFAETFENVEFQLPEVAKEWKVTHSENDSAKARCYMTFSPPEFEMFIVAVSPKVVEIPKTFTLDEVKAQIQTLMPSIDPVVEVIASDDHSVLLHMELDNFHQWNRIFYTDKGVATLLYQGALQENAPLWIDVLKNATVN